MRRYSRFAPSIVAFLLSLPGFGVPPLFDDFDFLGRVQSFQLWKLLPDPHVIFWRPVSRELYFGLVYALGQNGPFIGHLMSAFLLAFAVYQMVVVGETLGGRRVGIAAGFALAGFSQSPLLVAWLSGVQDLLALAFLLTAIRFRLERRFVAAAAALVFALLSKETAFAIIPLLIALDWIRDVRPPEIRKGLLLFGGIGLAWAAVHPGIHALIAAGFQDTPGGYVGLANPHREGAILKSIITLVNLPVSGLATPIRGAPWVLVGAAVAIVVFVWARGLGEDQALVGRSSGEPRDATITVGLLLCALPLTLTISIVRLWAPYYMAIPFLGIALVMGWIVSRLPLSAGTATLTIFLVLGGWCQNLLADPRQVTLKNLRPAAAALKQVEAGFKTLHPVLPAQTNMLVSVQSTGAASVYVHLYLLQTLRVWYRDPTITTHRPDFPIPTDRPSLLFWVDPAFGVHEIDLQTFEARPAGNEATFQEYKKTLRYYARGLAAGGDDMRAAFILVRIPESDPVIRGIDLRTGAMFFLYRGKRREADALLEKIPDLPEGARIAGMGAVLTSSPPGIVLDDAAFSAFELDPGDRDVVATLGRRFAADGRRDLAARFGARLLDLDPGNPEGQRWVDDLKRVPVSAKITRPGDEVGTPFE